MAGINPVAALQANWAMEHDQYQHYFYDEMDTEEDYFKSTAPSEDIWKKFELLPTPPMSPSRTFDSDTLFPLPADRLGWEPPKVVTLEEDYGGPYKIDPLDIFGNLSSIVIKDCMWSGFSASHQLEKVGYSERPPVTSQIKPPTASHTGVNTARVQRAAPGTPLTNTQATRCVNPTAVLSLPVLHAKKPTTASSGSESRSDSSDEDEVDVVTVDDRPRRGRPPGRRSPVTIAVSADPHGPCPKHFHVSLHRQQHNYAAPSPDSDGEDGSSQPPGKRLRPGPGVSPSPSLSPLSSPATSDSEDSAEQRRNFLERKRRDDLRSRFQALRSEIPGLSGSTKTSKVAILTSATEYLLQLRARERRQAHERKNLRARRHQLLRKISALKNP
ncbi:protein L-Myc-1a [Electrophorus electricus]|uniref:BHLH domain-containing protein n=2 Tax=Electrophorus TaxID=8004 RepID=A0A4W4EE25_ELEEL|nr:protein L-Myc-1a [Electrophorus electricus]